MEHVKSLKEIVEKLRSCGYTCEAGLLENNADFQLLERIAGVNKYTLDGLLSQKPAPKSAQQVRDEIVEKAKREVEEIRNDPIQMEGLLATFLVYREKRTVFALLASVSTGVVERQGVAKCHPDDCFNTHIGKIIALRRALGLEVPAEYLNAPQPTEVRVGDIVTRRTWSGVKQVAENGCTIPDQIRIKTAEYLLRNRALKITDDSRENETN